MVLPVIFLGDGKPVPCVEIVHSSVSLQGVWWGYH